MNDDLKSVIARCTFDIENDIIKPPAEQLSKELYADFKKLLVQNLGKWKAGKAQHFVFPKGTVEALQVAFENGDTPNFKQDWHYFPTPSSVIDQMCNIFIALEPLVILEPSCGRGDIVKHVNAFAPWCKHEWHLIEMNPVNKSFLEEEGFDVKHDDFDTYVPDKPVDVVFANPPFKRDIQHVAKMIECLGKGSSIVAVLPSNFETKYKEVIEKWEEMFEMVSFYKVPKGSFKSSGTGVDTVIMYMSYYEKEFGEYKSEYHLT